MRSREYIFARGEIAHAAGVLAAAGYKGKYLVAAMEDVGRAVAAGQKAYDAAMGLVGEMTITPPPPSADTPPGPCAGI